ncbi:MAG: hypothetical protein IJK15_03970 [Bacteroidaceae bacterium]|nr:hypothetical protein [Bacteroidaceae bacterium]
MKKNHRTRVGSEVQYGPRLAGAVLHDYLENSDDALAVAFRNQSTADEENEADRLFRDFFPDTHLCVDLKLITRKPGRMHVGEYINCMLTRDGEDHFEAVETATERKQAVRRNPIVYLGTCINLHRKADGTIYPTFNRPQFTSDFTFTDFCREAAEELTAVAGLIEVDE